MQLLTDILKALMLSPLKWLALLLLGFLLPVHGKRMFFMTTIYVRLINLKEPQLTALRPLVEQLKVAAQAEALMIPAFFAKLVWHKAMATDIEGLKTDNEIALRDYGMRLIGDTPKWMRYGRRDDMLSDLMRVVRVSHCSTQTV
jgi:hypothetical protein